MSSLLEQAIVDATALREAALKNAEASIIEKYAPEIKSAVETLLEQPELGGMDDMEPPAPEVDIDAPPAALADEDTCPCPPAGEPVEVELTLEALENMAKELMTEGETVEEDIKNPGPYMGKPRQVAGVDDDGDGVPDGADADPEDGDVNEQVEDLDESIQEEDFILDEEAIAALVEELVVDITPQKSGWAGMPESTMQHNLELELAHRASTEVKEENEALKKAIEELSESNTNLKKSNKTLKETVLKMKSAFDELSTSNAKLLYTNRILSSPSLNERQKEKIVEAISKAGSVDEAKVIYETLQSTGGTSRRRQMPKSLSETIQRSSTTVLPRRQPERTTDTAIDRLQILAGIKNNK